MLVKSRVTIQYRKLFFLPVSFSLFIFLITFILSSPLLAKEKDRLSGEKQKKIIEALCTKLENLYPIPEIGKKTSNTIRNNHKNGKYAKFTQPSEFVQHLNDDLESISEDGHLGIVYDPAMASELKKEEEKQDQGDTYAELMLESERWKNFGFKELKILEGNIGYLDLRTFFSLKYAAETAVASMNFFSNCNALIIDLRENGGGWDDMVTFLTSYFLNAGDDIIFSIAHSTLDDSYYASIPYAYVPGKRLADIPICILTSGSTASAAEAFTNIMKHLRKNTLIVGETTAGAENPVERLFLFDEYVLRIPCWQKVYSYDKVGWEGTGVKPNIEVDSEKALDVAHMNILLQLKEENTDETIESMYQWAIDGLKAFYNPVTVPEDILQSYPGKYGSRNIYYEDRILYYQYKGGTKREMFAVSNEYFLVQGYDFLRVKFIKEKDAIRGISEIFDDGTIVELTKE
jgi:hypothetical protein